jgi:3',5'-cyclic AMP phosphodiesterase CpdA
MDSRTHEIIVVSDLHIGRGKNPETGRYYELETFFYDDDFRGFCEYLCVDAGRRAVDFKLILNGDTFDLLRVDRDVGQRAASETASLTRGGRFGPVMTPATAAAVLTETMDSHRGFVEGLTSVLLAGHEVVFLPGNHDLEIQWPRVQDVIRDRIVARARVRAADGGRDPESAARCVDEQLRFEPWFYYEPGRAWIEHGCQYDPENAFRYLLRGALDHADERVLAAEVDMPLGNFFQRYLYNAFGQITFIVPSTRANLRYFKWLILNKPRLLLRVFGSHGRFWMQVVRRLAKPGQAARRAMRACHKTALGQLAASSGLGTRLHAIDALKARRTDVHQTIRSFGWQALRVLAAAILIALTAFGLWFAGFHGINQLRGGFIVKASLFLVLEFFFLLVAMGGVGYAVLRSAAAPSSRPLRKAACRIAEIVDVPLVSFGHTHEEVMWNVSVRGGPGASAARGAPVWYHNTGTWIAVFTHDVLLPRDRVQYTYLHIRGRCGELLHWSPGRGAPIPVILLDEHEPDAGPQLPS